MKPQPASTIRQIVRNRPRLLIAAAIGTATTFLLPLPVGPVGRALVGWNVTVWLYLLLVGILMVRATHTRVRRIAEQEDRSAVFVLAFMSLAAVVSVAAIVLELSTTKDLDSGRRTFHYALTASTVLGSWFLVGMLFTLHYARIFYQSPVEERALRFPDGEEEPNYWEFLYFSFTIAVAAQTSDVSILSRALRKTALAQSVLSFFFNAAIIGIAINIAAGLIGS
jgi:uncharacterized membrane protein